MESIENGKILNSLGLYLKRDVWLWAGAYQTFRNESKNFFKLEPLRYKSIAGHSWDAMENITGIRLKLFQILKSINPLKAW